MTTIIENSTFVTFINVFTVDPADQQRLVNLLVKVTATFVSRAPGFVSAALHRSIDGTRVTMYSQWRTLEDYEAVRSDPAPAPLFQEGLTFARFEPGRYEVVQVVAPSIDHAGP